MRIGQIILGFLPFIVFTFADRIVDVTVAAPVAGVVALGVLLAGARRGLQLVAATGVVAFAVVAVVSQVDSSTSSYLSTYADSLVKLALAAVILATAPFFPFTQVFARASVPKDVWHSPRFLATNRTISAAWGVAIGVAGVSGLIAEILNASSDGSSHLVLAWGVPILAYVAAVRYTMSTVESAQDRSNT